MGQPYEIKGVKGVPNTGKGFGAGSEHVAAIPELESCINDRIENKLKELEARTLETIRKENKDFTHKIEERLASGETKTASLQSDQAKCFSLLEAIARANHIDGNKITSAAGEASGTPKHIGDAPSVASQPVPKAARTEEENQNNPKPIP